MNRTTLTNAFRPLALLTLILAALATMPACNTVAGFGKDIQAIAGGGQDVIDDVSGRQTQQAEAY